MSAAEETGAPNLDAMPRDELLQWKRAVHEHEIKVARQLFPLKPPGYLRATRDLCVYADLKATAMQMRLNGNINGALHYEGLCESIYNRLPDYARW